MSAWFSDRSFLAPLQGAGPLVFVSSQQHLRAPGDHRGSVRPGVQKVLRPAADARRGTVAGGRQGKCWLSGRLQRELDPARRSALDTILLILQESGKTKVQHRLILDLTEHHAPKGPPTDNRYPRWASADVLPGAAGAGQNVQMCRHTKQSGRPPAPKPAPPCRSRVAQAPA
jgi:hypothetical protein